MPYGNYQQPSAFHGGYDYAPAQSRGESSAGSTGGLDLSSFSGGGGGGGWGALVSGLIQQYNKHQAAIAAGPAAAAEYQGNVDPEYLKPILERMAGEGRILSSSVLSSRARSIAEQAGRQAAASHGIQGGLAATLESQSVGDATNAFNQWRQAALQQQRGEYLNLLNAYHQMAARRRSAYIASKLAEREAAANQWHWFGPLGVEISRARLRDNDQYGLSDRSIYGTAPTDTYSGQSF